MHVCKHTSPERHASMIQYCGYIKAGVLRRIKMFLNKRPSVHSMISRTKTPQYVTSLQIMTENLNIFHLVDGYSVSERTLVHHSRSKCLPSPLPIEWSILLKLMWGRHASKPLNLSSLSSALTFMRRWHTGKWLSLGQHVLSLYANAMLRWLYEGPPKRPISFGGAGPCLMKVFYILYI